MLQSWLDRSILFSFDRTGFIRHIKNHPLTTERSLKDLTIAITGATSGIGKALCENLASLGAHLLLVNRNPEKAHALSQCLKTRFPKCRLSLDTLSLEDLHAVRNYTPKHKVDVWVHNAGAMPPNRSLTKEGHELTFATHVLAPFILTENLILQKKLHDHGRVLFVSSGGMYAEKIHIEDLNTIQRPYNKLRVYAQAKRCQVYLAEFFAEKYPLYFFGSMHPGWAKTPGVRRSMPLFYYFLYFLLRTPSQGADTLEYLIRLKEIHPNGKFWFDRACVPTDFYSYTKASKQEKEALWNFCLSHLN